MADVLSATLANLPRVYAFSLVRPPPPKTPTPSAPYRRWTRVMPSATRSSASSQDAGRSGLVRSPGTVRTNGVSSRSLWSNRFAAVHPLEHRPPRLVGKTSCGCSVAGRFPATITIPHCREQYGQWVAVVTARAAALTLVSVEGRCFGGPRAVLRADCVVLTFAGQGCAVVVTKSSKRM